MDKILISLFVPALPKYYEIFIPTDMPVAQMLKLIISGVTELSSNRYFSSGEELLFWDQFGALSALNRTPCDYGLKNGDTLMLL